MGLFEGDEHTLYEPADPAEGPLKAVRLADVDEGEGSLLDVLAAAWNAAWRRRRSSVLLLVLGAASTVTAAHYAPRSYRASGEVLVVSTGETTDSRRQQLEWEHQIRAHESLAGIARDAHVDDLERLERNVFVSVDQNTVTVDAEWNDPVVAQDLVQAALTRFIDKRYETEVRASTTRLAPLEAQAETSRLALERLDPGHAPPPFVPAAEAPSPESVAALRALPAARDRQTSAAAKLAALEAEQRARIDRLETERSDKARTMALGHPEMTALGLQLAKAREDTPSLVAARAEKSAADANLADVAATARVPVPRAHVAPAPTPALDELGLRRLAAAQEDYDKKRDALDEENLKLRVAEAAFQSKYQVTRPPELPRAPVKPIAAMVGVGGALASVLFVLALATLRDRRAGLFFEAKHVRDRLRLPVLGELRDGQLTA